MADRDLSGRTVGGDFVLVERLDEGGGGVVYRSFQRSLGREVVVKVMHDDDDSIVAKKRFVREAKLASQLRHPYAAHVYGAGIEGRDEVLWLAMEKVEGVTLKSWLETHGPMPLERCLQYFECVAQVVDAAHGLGIIHRDLKPTNMMVLEHEGQWIPKLLDFGIAKVDRELTCLPSGAWPDGSLAESVLRGDDPANEPHSHRSASETIDDAASEMLGDVAPAKTTGRKQDATPPMPEMVKLKFDLTQPDHGLGSAWYTSPEQGRNAWKVGPASDIYSLAIVIYEALTGRVPFDGDSTTEQRLQHISDPVPPLGGDFSPELDRVLRQALAKKPEERHRTARELVADLRATVGASERAQLRSAAHQWDDRGRPRAMLWRMGMLASVDHWKGTFNPLECSFVAESARFARSVRWFGRALVGVAVLGILGTAVFKTRWAEERVRLAQEQSRSAKRVVDVTITQSELEQGRAALLQRDPDARAHLAEAYRRDPSPSTAFMLARALQPRLAEQARLSSTSGRMWSARFSPHGDQIVTTDDRSARLWDAKTNRLRFTLSHDDAVYDAVYAHDGTRLATASADGTVKIWDTSSGALVHELGRDSPKLRYRSVAISPDNKLVTAIDVDGKATRVWAMYSGSLLAELSDDGSGFPRLAFSADGDWLATSGGDDVRVFDTRTWARALTIPGPGIHALSFDVHRPHLVTGSEDGDMSIWSIPSGERLRHRELSEPVDAVALSPDGQLVAAATRNGVEQIWNIATGKLKSHSNDLRDKIYSIEFDPASELIVAASGSGDVSIVQAASGILVAMLEGPTNIVRTARFDPRLGRVIGASWDGTARIWDAASTYRRWGSSSMAASCGVTTSLQPDDQIVAVSCIDHPTRVWDTTRDLLLAELPSVTQVGGDFASAYPAVSALGDRAAIARGNTVEIYEMPSAELVRTIVHGAAVNTVAFANAGHDVVSGAIDGSLLISRDGQGSVALPSFSDGVDATGFLADGRIVAAAGKHLRIYAPQSTTMLAELPVPARVRMFRMSPDGRRLVTVPSYSGGGTSVLWDLERFRIIAKLEGASLYSARFVAGSHDVLAACADGAARLWDGDTGELRHVYRGGSHFLGDATLSPDGQMVVAGGADGVLRFWDATTARALWTMPAHKSALIGLHFDEGDLVTRGSSGEISRWRLPPSEYVIEACRKRGIVLQ